MTKRARAVATTRRALRAARTVSYKPQAFPWTGLFIGIGLATFLAVVTAPRNER